MRILIATILFISAFVCANCSTRADSISPIETVKEFFSNEDEKDLESKFIGKETLSNWKVETIEIKDIKVINGLFFVDDVHGWLIGAFDTIYRTENGGKSWEKINIKIPEKTSVSKIYFTNQNEGWLIFEKYNISILEAGNEQFGIMKTSDGGKTWKLTFTEKATVVGEMKFANEKIGYITGYKYDEPKQTPIKANGYFIKTEDGGEIWTDLSKQFNDFKLIEDNKIKTQYMNDIAENFYFFNPNHFRLTTHSRRVLESKDGGLTWSKITQYTHDDQQVGIKNLGYKDDETEWYLESTYSIEGIRARLKTKNSQNQIIRRLIQGVYFNSAFYLSDNNFVAAGKEGNLTKDDDEVVIWLTKDDGQTWSEIYRNKKAKGIRTMIQVSKNSFWALCENKEILHLFQN